MKNKCRSPFLLWVILVLVGLSSLTPLRAEKVVPAKIRVTGLGLWQNREMRLVLERMLGTNRGSTLGVNAIEDSAFSLLSILNDEGFQAPVITVRATTAEGKAEVYRLDANLDVSLSRGLEAREIRFEVNTGMRSYVDRVGIVGLQALSVNEAELFFRPSPTAITFESARAYAPIRVKRGAEKLREELRQRGYAEAKVQAWRTDTEQAKGGPVALQVQVEEGPLWIVSEVRYEKANPGEVSLPKASGLGEAWTPTLQQNFTEQIRQAYYRKGYADVAVRLRTETAAAREGRSSVVVLVQIEPGPLVTVGEVRFKGNEYTHEPVMRRRVPVKSGDLLDPVRLESARYRLSHLGVFEAVDLRYEPREGVVRDPVFVVREGPRYEANLLAGYGSYEELRGGIEVRYMNLFGRAHQSRLSLVQSMKGSRGEYGYTMPELFGETVDGTARVFGLQREELSFLRQEYGANVTLKRRVPWVGADGMVGYTFQSLKNRDNELTTRAVDSTQVNVGSIDLSLVRDRRDSPLHPRRGYRWFGQVEAANPALGGEASYERYVVGGAYHFAVGKWQFIHVGFTHGALTTFGTTDLSVPVNKRFFPGGDGSIRGYLEGEAAPRGLDGRFIGAKTYAVLNLECEQVLTESWSVVAFFDGLGSAAKLADYPFDERLYSVGLGLRYQTLVGPIRLEYGHNLNPREGDPSGTLHLSVGFPF